MKTSIFLSGAIAGAVVSAIICVAVAVMLWPSSPAAGPPEIREVVVTKTVYLKPPQTECERNEISITAKATVDSIHVIASDGCKTAEADIYTEKCRPPWPHDVKKDVLIPGGCLVLGVIIGALL